ncbi:MAG: hypothetical protein A2Z03_10565 [Chloroflexi bacterium RBG_16_56_8]|nr:MAG: hypothetical protein A2Z03_10565 [Chloroflexi bacterium RBG_16_56_8]
MATHTATPERRPGLGRIILSDDFSDPDLWTVAVSDQASAAIQDERLTIAVQPGVYMISQRRDLVFSDFYAEITARPSLCRGADDYGLLVRGSSIAYYRFTLSCNGTARVERAVYTRQEERHVLQEAVFSGDVPPGAPGEVKIGVWAAGAEMRLFLNDRFQFSLTDSNYPSGLIGVFARSSGDTPAAITFSDLTVRELDYSPPSETPQP